MHVLRRQQDTRTGLYTEAERRRRDSSPWTLVQAILAPLQFVVFLVSLGLVLRTLATGEGGTAANISIILKTLLLYTIMVTGSLWEKDVFGKYLFAPAFFWEDAVSFAGEHPAGCSVAMAAASPQQMAAYRMTARQFGEDFTKAVTPRATAVKCPAGGITPVSAR